MKKVMANVTLNRKEMLQIYSNVPLVVYPSKVLLIVPRK